MHDVVADAVLRVRRRSGDAPTGARVRLVLAEQRLRRRRRRRASAVPRSGARRRARRSSSRSARRLGVARPTTTCCGTRASAARGASRRRGRRCGRVTRMQMSSGAGLGVVGGDLPVAAVVEDAGVEQLVLAARLAARRVLGDQLARTGTRPAGTGSASASTSGSAWSRGTTSTPWRPRRGCPPGRSRPKIRSLRIGSRPFQNARAKHRRCRSSQMPREAVLVPAVGARAGVVVGERVPRVAVGAVVLAHRAPGALGEVRPPAPPRRAAPAEPRSTARALYSGLY